MDRAFALEYTQQFWDDISEAIRYIVYELRNPPAAQKLKDDTEREIRSRSFSPLSYEPYFTDEETGDVYYYIRVGNFMVFYVVEGEVMEVRRFVYGRRNLGKVLSDRTDG